MYLLKHYEYLGGSSITCSAQGLQNIKINGTSLVEEGYTYVYHFGSLALVPISSCWSTVCSQRTNSSTISSLVLLRLMNTCGRDSLFIYMLLCMMCKTDIYVLVEKEWLNFLFDFIGAASRVTHSVFSNIKEDAVTGKAVSVNFSHFPFWILQDLLSWEVLDFGSRGQNSGIKQVNLVW